jgi:hypothetical protein
MAALISSMICVFKFSFSSEAWRECEGRTENPPAEEVDVRTDVAAESSVNCRHRQ